MGLNNFIDALEDHRMRMLTNFHCRDNNITNMEPNRMSKLITCSRIKYLDLENNDLKEKTSLALYDAIHYTVHM